jgi:hypothetical protein
MKKNNSQEVSTVILSQPNDYLVRIFINKIMRIFFFVPPKMEPYLWWDGQTLKRMPRGI